MQYVNLGTATENIQTYYSDFGDLKTDIDIKRDIACEDISYSEEYSNNLRSEENENCEIIVLPPSSNGIRSNLGSINESQEISTEESKSKFINQINCNKVTKNLKKIWSCALCPKIFLAMEMFELHLKTHRFEHVCKALVSLTIPKLVAFMPSIKSSDSISPTALPCLASELIKLKEKSSQDTITNKVTNVRNETLQNNITSTRNIFDMQKVNSKQIGSKGIAQKIRNNSEYEHLKSRDPHRCQICSTVLSSRGNLAKHIIIHQEDKPFLCKLCKIGFNAKRDLQQHHNMCHANLPPGICPICNKKCCSPLSLKNHKAIHKPDKFSQCSKCQKWYKSVKCLKQHMARHTNKSRFPCSFCPKKFKVKRNLIIHVLKSHSNLNRSNHESLNT